MTADRGIGFDNPDPRAIFSANRILMPAWNIRGAIGDEPVQAEFPVSNSKPISMGLTSEPLGRSASDQTVAPQ